MMMIPTILQKIERIRLKIASTTTLVIGIALFGVGMGMKSCNDVMQDRATIVHTQKQENHANIEYVHDVVKIIDGDTIDVMYHGKKERVRMLYINTPERGKQGYEEATEAMRSMVEGKRVGLVKEGRDRGNYGRLLRHVFVDGKLVNVEMIKLGHTEYWTKYGKTELYEKEYTQK